MPRQARILWITEWHPPLGGGMAVSSGRQVESLRRRGLTVDLLAFTEAENRAVLRTEYRDGGLDFHLSRTLKPGPAAQQAWHLVSSENARRPYAFTVGFGANRPGHLAVTYAAWLDCPSLILVRGNDFDQDWFDPGRGPWVVGALDRADVIGVVASGLKNRLQALFPGKNLRLVPNAVDPAWGELLPADRARRDETRSRLEGDRKKIIGLFGELKHKKAAPFWLAALRDTGLMDRTALLLVGRRTDEELNQVLSDPVLAPRNLCLPFLLRDQLPGLYAACDFLAVPSYYDGLPNVLLEAMSLGVVPIVSDAGALAEVVQDGETGFVFPAADRQAAAEVTARALNLPENQRLAMGRRAREYVIENHSPDREAEVLMDILLGGPETARAGG
ncbi:MAG: glycosyltransferase family 4 protein [Thermodesulfobacteriota bacterium]